MNIDIKDINNQPSLEDIDQYIQSPLFQQLYQHLNKEYKALCKIEYSKDVWFPGWNVKFRKSGKALCVVYPQVKFFTVLVVVSQKEKELVENKLSQLSQYVQDVYHQTKEGNGQRWLMIDVINEDIYRDILQLIHIRYIQRNRR